MRLSLKIFSCDSFQLLICGSPYLDATLVSETVKTKFKKKKENRKYLFKNDVRGRKDSMKTIGAYEEDKRSCMWLNWYPPEVNVDSMFELLDCKLDIGEN